MRADTDRAASRGDRRAGPRGDGLGPRRRRQTWRCDRRPPTSWPCCASCRRRSAAEGERDDRHPDETEVGDRRRRAGRARALPPARGSGGIDCVVLEQPRPRVRRAPRPRRRARAPDRRAAAQPRARRPARPRGPRRTAASSWRSRAGATASTSSSSSAGRSPCTASRRSSRTSSPPASPPAARSCSRPSTSTPVDVDTDQPGRPLPPRRRAPRAALPDRRRLRRVPRRVPRRSCPDWPWPSGSTRSPGSGSWPRRRRRRTS